MATSPTSRRSEQAGPSPLPLAIAVLGPAPGVTEEDHRKARLALALSAYQLGYFVLDIVEVAPGGQDSSGYTWVEALAERTDAAALVIAGAVDMELLDTVADRNRMVVRLV